MGYRDSTGQERERFEKISAGLLSLSPRAELDEKRGRLIRYSSLFGQTNIGGLCEKALHLTFKYFFEENADLHEVYVEGFYADIMHNGEICEIQTGSFSSFRKKLSVLAQRYPLMIVHPIVKDRKILTVDADSGQLLSSRMSPVHKNIYSAFTELVYIREQLGCENISLCFPLVSVEEVRIFHPSAKRKIKESLVPRELFGFYEFDSPFALASLLPDTKKEYYTAKDVARTLGIPHGTAGAMLNVMTYLDVLKKDGKEGRSIRYIRGKNY